VVSSELQDFDKSLAFGEGKLLWKYKPKVLTAALSDYCAGRVLEECRFERGGSPESGVDTYVRMEDGVLTIGEIWN
jgi:hypothetical protein